VAGSRPAIRSGPAVASGGPNAAVHERLAANPGGIHPARTRAATKGQMERRLQRIEGCGLEWPRLILGS
jgi:hypothetical protein